MEKNIPPRRSLSLLSVREGSWGRHLGKAAVAGQEGFPLPQGSTHAFSQRVIASLQS